MRVAALRPGCRGRGLGLCSAWVVAFGSGGRVRIGWPHRRLAFRGWFGPGGWPVLPPRFGLHPLKPWCRWAFASMSLAWHLTLRTENGAPLATTVGELRALARLVLAVGAAYGLFVFRVPDNHLHAGLRCPREQAGRFAQRVASSLAQTGRVLEPARIRAIDSQAHLEHVVDYVLRQDLRHATRLDPLAEASNLPDLLGLRVLGAHTARTLVEVMPRVRRGRLWEHLGGPVDPALHLDLLAEAAAAAVAREAVTGSAVDERAARAAAVAFARGSLGAPATARLLGVSPATGSRALREPVEPALVHAIGLQCALRHRFRLGDAPLGPTEGSGPPR